LSDAIGAPWSCFQQRISLDRCACVFQLKLQDIQQLRPFNFADRKNSVPLMKGSSKSVVSSNIKTLVDDWQRDGSIGTSHPPTKKKAVKQAIAIALSKAGKSRGT